MAKYLNPKVKEYFRRDRAASVWWNVDTLPRYRQQTEWVARHIAFQQKRVLDLATGKGRFSITAALNGAESVTAVDISGQMISEAREKASIAGIEHKITFCEDDIEHFLSDTLYDVIFLMEVLVHIPDPQHVLSNCRNMLKPEGILAVNIDLPITDHPLYQQANQATKVLYMCIPHSIRKLFNQYWGWPLMVDQKIMKNTTDETLRDMDLHPEKKYSRAKDAFRPIRYAELLNYLTQAGLTVVTVKKEYYLGLNVGYLLLASPTKE